jgi:hypothetical protein
VILGNYFWRGTAEFGDIRRNARAIEIAEKLDNSFEKSASASLPESADYKGALRFVKIEAVTPDSILSPFIDYNLENLDANHVLVIQDTTEFNFSWRKKTKITGLGPVGNNVDQGFFFHPGLIVNPKNECVLGLAAAKFWTRDFEEQTKGKKKIQDKPFTERESYRWLSLAQDVQERATENLKITIVGDRESDIFDVFEAKALGILNENCELLIRSARDRRLESSEKSLFSTIKDWDIKGRYCLYIKPTLDRKGRESEMAVKYGCVSIQPPNTKWNSGKKPVQNIYVVDVREINPPDEKSEVHWTLLTTWEVTSFEAAVEKINWYSSRWFIEELFRMLKSGYKVEKVKFDNGQALMNWCALRIMQAIRLFHLLTQRDLKTMNSALTFFSNAEIKILEYLEENNLSKKTKVEVPPKLSIAWAVLLIAIFGGYKAYPSAKPPGQQSLWRGLAKLEAAQIGFLAANGKCG